MNRATTERKRYTLTELLTSDEVLESANTRDCLLGHGIRLFHRYGVDGASVGRILKASNKSKSQFYSHFGSREDFICQVLKRQMTTMIKVSSRTPFKKVEDFPDWFAPYEELGSLPGHLGCPTGPLATDLSPSCEVVRAEASRQFNLWQNYIADCFAQLFKELGTSPISSSKELADQFCCSLQGAFLLGRVHQTGDYVELVGKQYYSLLKSLACSRIP